MKIFEISLDMPLHPGDISGFRAAIVELVGREHDLFHNHDASGDARHTHWRYPLIQYQVRRGRATLLALSEGVEQVKQKLLPALPEVMSFAGRQHPVNGYCVRMRDYSWSLHDRGLAYGLVRWLGLNAENYSTWKKMKDPERQKMLLGRALTGHLRAFAEVAQVPFKDELTAKVLEVHGLKRVKWHGTDFIGFNLSFESNLALPLHVGLGRCVAFGFGEILSASAYENFCAIQQRQAKRGRPRLV